MDNELYHYGVKGMKWGVRRDRRHQAKLSKYRDKKIRRNERYAKKEFGKATEFANRDPLGVSKSVVNGHRYTSTNKSLAAVHRNAGRAYIRNNQDLKKLTISGSTSKREIKDVSAGISRMTDKEKRERKMRKTAKAALITYGAAFVAAPNIAGLAVGSVVTAAVTSDPLAYMPQRFV